MGVVALGCGSSPKAMTSQTATTPSGATVTAPGVPGGYEWKLQSPPVQYAYVLKSHPGTLMLHFDAGGSCGGGESHPKSAALDVSERANVIRVDASVWQATLTHVPADHACA